MNKEERLYGENILKQWAEAKSNIISIQNEINYIKNNTNNLFSNELLNDDEIKQTYNQLIYELLSQMKIKMIKFKYVEDIINNLDNFEKNIIINRYQKKYSWDKIALESHISRTNCFNIKNKIIKKLLNK